MSLNCSEINEILTELDLKGAFIQEIVQPSFDSIALYTYKPGDAKTVFISLAPSACRICAVKRKIPKNEKPLRFNELLRSKIKGARITECRQIGLERIIEIKTEKDGPIFVMPAATQKFAQNAKASARRNSFTDEEDETDRKENLTLYIRLWSNAGNIFLCTEDFSIIDCFYRRPHKNETGGNTFKIPAEKVYDTEMLKKFPVRTFKEELSQYCSEKNIDFNSLSFNEKTDLFYSQSALNSSLSSLLEQAEKWYNSRRSRQESVLKNLEEKFSSYKNAEQLKHYGDLILANAYKIDGTQDSIECEDWNTQNEGTKTVSIKIDRTKNAQENAGIFYEKYKKQTRALETLAEDIKSAQEELDSLDRQYKNLVTEKNPLKLEQILRKTQKPRQQEKQERPGLSYEVNGWTIFVGRDSTENDELLRHYVKGADLWFHTRDYAGGYVFIKSRAGKTVPLEIMLIAGNLAVYHSKARKNGQADLYYTQVKHLRRAKNGPKGLVLPSNEKNLFVKLDMKKLRNLDADEN